MYSWPSVRVVVRKWTLSLFITGNLRFANMPRTAASRKGPCRSRKLPRVSGRVWEDVKKRSREEQKVIHERVGLFCCFLGTVNNRKNLQPKVNETGSISIKCFLHLSASSYCRASCYLLSCPLEIISHHLIHFVHLKTTMHQRCNTADGR